MSRTPDANCHDSHLLPASYWFHWSRVTPYAAQQQLRGLFTSSRAIEFSTFPVVINGVPETGTLDRVLNVKVLWCQGPLSSVVGDRGRPGVRTGVYFLPFLYPREEEQPVCALTGRSARQIKSPPAVAKGERAVDQADHDIIRGFEARLDPQDLTRQLIVRTQLRRDLPRHRSEAVVRGRLRIVTTPPVVRELERRQASIVPRRELGDAP